MPEKNDIQLLAKLGQCVYMERLFDHGELYFRSMRDFARMEETDGIGDKLETAVRYNCPPDPEITIIFPDGEKLKLSKESRIEYYEHDTEKNGHIYCMAMVEFVYIDNENLIIKHPEKIEQIGGDYSSMVIITNPNAFLDRIRRKVGELGYDLLYAPISYFPEKDIMRKTITPFDKRERYAYQNEFRIFINCDLKDPLLITIGNIEDIATIVHAKPKE